MNKECDELLERFWRMRQQILKIQCRNQHRGEKLNLYVGHYEYDVFMALANSGCGGSEIMSVNGTNIPAEKYSIFGIVVNLYLVDECNHLTWGYENAL